MGGLKSFHFIGVNVSLSFLPQMVRIYIDGEQWLDERMRLQSVLSGWKIPRVSQNDGWKQDCSAKYISGLL